jgi:hypothetical protein
VSAFFRRQTWHHELQHRHSLCHGTAAAAEACVSAHNGAKLANRVRKVGGYLGLGSQ